MEFKELRFMIAEVIVEQDKETIENYIAELKRITGILEELNERIAH